MAAYVIVDINIHDPSSYETYKLLTPSSIAAYDGSFVIRGGKTITLEGDWKPERIVVLKFSSIERAKQWWDSLEYAVAKAIRQAASFTKMIIVEGVE